MKKETYRVLLLLCLPKEVSKKRQAAPTSRPTKVFPRLRSPIAGRDKLLAFNGGASAQHAMAYRSGLGEAHSLQYQVGARSLVEAIQR